MNLAARLLVEFLPLNLIDPIWPLEKSSEVTLCRKVLTYLEAGCRLSILERMAELLAPDGWLIFDPVEHPGASEQLFSPGKMDVYSPRSHLSMNPTTGRSPGHRLEPLSP
ncbi:MAG: hypothetical protein EXS32_04010 [Opitutus sp.]|nr:hypothetical protein [Opitutus sp.]